MPVYETEMKDSGLKGARYETQSASEKDKEIARLKAIVTELADELENHNGDHLQDDLIQRAKEATRLN